MNNIFLILLVLAAVCVAASLALGLLVMARGGETSRKYGNKLMQARVILQGVAVLLFILAALSGK